MKNASLFLLLAIGLLLGSRRVAAQAVFNRDLAVTNILIPTLLKREAVGNLLCRLDARKLSAAGKRAYPETIKEPALTLY